MDMLVIPTISFRLLYGLLIRDLVDNFREQGMYLDEPGRSRHPPTPTSRAAGLLHLLRATHSSRSGLRLPLRRQCHATV
jgi:hypothetical protein